MRRGRAAREGARMGLLPRLSARLSVMLLLRDDGVFFQLKVVEPVTPPDGRVASGGRARRLRAGGGPGKGRHQPEREGARTDGPDQGWRRPSWRVVGITT